MHSFWQRANALFTYAGTLLALMCLATTITDCFHVSHPSVHVEYQGVDGIQQEYRHDQAYLVLNVTADLRSVFTWNTKQLFLYVNVDFATPSNPGNSMVMWSQIVRASEDAVLEAPYLRSGYPFAVTDQRQEMLGREFNVTVVWHVMPRVGRLYKDSRTFSGFRFPSQYIKAEKGNIRRGDNVDDEYAAADEEE